MGPERPTGRVCVCVPTDAIHPGREGKDPTGPRVHRPQFESEPRVRPFPHPRGGSTGAEFGVLVLRSFGLIPAPIVRRSRLFPLWGGFWVAPIVESSVVKPDGWLNVYLAAFNLTKRQQEHSLRATDAEIPEGMRGNLSFSLHPGRWAVQLVSVPTNRGAGEHSVSFKTRSGAERAATAVAVGVLTLGSFIYAPGSSGFSLRYTVLTPETAQNVTQWEGYAMQSADRRFKEAGANAIDDGKGGRISQATVLQQFRAYLTPSLLLAALRSKRAAPEVVIASLLDEFLFDAFGIKGSQNAFVAG